MRKIIKIIIISCLLLTTTIAECKKQKECTVRGRVVDDNGNPVEKAIIIVDSGPPTSWEDLIECSETDDDGKFSYRLENCPFPQETRTLYVTSYPNYDSYVPFSAPFLRSKELGNKFAGQLLKNRKKEDVNVGDVRVQVFFSTVIVYLTDENGHLLLSEEEWQNVWFRLKSENNVDVSTSSLSKNNLSHAVRSKESAIAIDLPEGKWQIEISKNWEKQIWLKPNIFIVVLRASSTFNITLQMAKHNKPLKL